MPRKTATILLFVRTDLASALDPRAYGWRQYAAASALAFSCFFPILRLGVTSMHGIRQPYDIDEYRDIASAQAIADGRFPADPDYPGETFWYNPLLPATVAAFRAVSGLEMPVALVRAGLVLNTIAAVAFFVMAASSFGPWAALAALAALLYLPQFGDPPWATASWSPWLFAATFAPAFFYTTLLAWRRAMQEDRLAWWCAGGAAAGLTFMTHTGPALILVLCAAPWLFGPRVTDGKAGRGHGPAARIAVAGLASLVASTPMLWMLARHRLRILNRAPLAWTWGPLADWHHLIGRIAGWKLLFVLIGLAVLALRARTDAGAKLVIGWFVAACATLIYGYMGLTLPVPLFHFYLYLNAACAVLIGVAAWAVIASVASALVSLVREGPTMSRSWPAAALAILALLFAWDRRSSVLERPWVGEFRFIALKSTVQEADARIRERLRSQTAVDAVVLASLDSALTYVAPAGRSVLCVPIAFSNPFVAYEPRVQAHHALMSALLGRDRATFTRVARREGITNVLLEPADAIIFETRGGMPDVLAPLSRDGGFVLYEVRALGH